MNKETLLKRLKQGLNAIECDRYSHEILSDLYNDIYKEGIN
jgi:hypothetical protein